MINVRVRVGVVFIPPCLLYLLDDRESGHKIMIIIMRTDQSICKLRLVISSAFVGVPQIGVKMSALKAEQYGRITIRLHENLNIFEHVILK